MAQTDSLAVDTVAAEHTHRKGVLRPVYWLYDYLKNTNKHEDRAFDCSLLFGPSYSTTSSLGLGGGLSGLYKWDRNDPTLTKSNVSLFFNGTISGIFQVGLKGNNYFPHDKQRWNYKMTLQSIPTQFWGIGYGNGDLDANEGNYHQVKVHFLSDYVFRVAKNFYIGPEVNINYSHNYHFDNPDPSRIQYQERDIMSSGAGVLVQYDSRDFNLNAYRGNYVKLEQLFFPKVFNTYYFNRTELTYDAYRPVWKKCILALDLHTQLNYGGNVPWTMLAFVGEGNSRMRGYYEGRYRDRNIVEGQLELRQRLKWRLGVVAFVGCANVFNDFDEINLRHTLPNYGMGLRWEFKPRVNFRFDVGMTKNGPGFCVNMNEAF